jgi:two-component system, LuxR family, sensor kinase FixL
MSQNDLEPTNTTDLRPVRERLQQTLSVLDAVADGIVLIEESGAIAELNAAALELFGIGPDAAHGGSITDLLPDLAPLFPAGKLLAASRARGGIEAEASRPSGAIPVHITVSESLSRGGAEYILVVRDFRAVHSAQRRLLETERLAAIGETMTALAHESRNALQRMQSCLTLLKLRGGGEVQDLVDDMQEAQDQLQRLYEEVRSFAAPVQMRMRRTDARKLLEKTWRQLRLAWVPKRVRCEFDVVKEEPLPMVRADAGRLGQAFRNVLENAIEAAPPGTAIVVRTTLPGPVSDPSLRIDIEDEGPGIPATTREHVFDLLFTTKHGGTGMGLAIAKRIVHEHRGEIEIDGSELGGARVTVSLPLVGSSGLGLG